MKRLISVILSLLILFGCQAKPLEWENLTILSPKGAPALSLIPLLDEAKDQIEFVDGTDVISAELIKGEQDMIIAPVNLGAALSKKGENQYRLYAIVTWGNLYLVGPSNTDINAETVAIFGEQAVPGLVFKQVLNQSTEAFASVTDVQGQLLAGQYKVGLLAEPLVTATIAKAKSLTPALELSILSDLQELWSSKTGQDNYPQAAIFVKADLSEDKQAQIDARLLKMQAYNEAINQNPSQLETDITEERLTQLGVPSGKILASAWERMNINVQAIAEVKDAVEVFLKLFKLNGLENYYYE